MSLRDALQPLLGIDGLVALLVLTSDGLPVEMFGYGLRAERLAAEMAGVAGSARRGLRSLGLSEPSRQRIEAGSHNVEIFPLEEHYLVVVVDRARERELAPRVLESTLGPLRLALRGDT